MSNCCGVTDRDPAIAMNTSSVVLLSLIGGVMLVVAVRTVKYNKARDRAYEAYRKAVGMLRSEFKENLALTERTRVELASGTVSKDRFRARAWSLLLKEPFLPQMDEEALTDLRRIYGVIEEAETYRSRLIESRNQQPDSPDSVRVGDLLQTLDELATKLQKHLARVSEEV
jgi:hypothetical protein